MRGAGRRAGRKPFLVKNESITKISYSRIANIINQDVIPRQVSVDDVVIMKVLESTRHLSQLPKNGEGQISL